MDIEKAKRIQKIYNWTRFMIIAIVLLLLAVVSAKAQNNVEERLLLLEQRYESLQEVQQKDSVRHEHIPHLHGILRGKYEYEPDAGSRFEVRNARMSISGAFPLRSEYKVEVDLCDESQIKMKDAWVRMNPWQTLRVSIGQQRMPFSIDAHRNPSAQYFANRSVIAKQVGDVRDVGAQVGYDFMNKKGRKVLSVDAGIFNGSNIDNQKTAWFSSPSYSARIQYYPVKGMAIVPSIQHQQIANREAAYTSLDFGSFYETNCFHCEAEYLHKFYTKEAFDDCNAVDVMVIYKTPLHCKSSNKSPFVNGISYLLRYDYMDNHSDGKEGLGTDGKLQLSDYARNRLTAGITLHIDNKYFPTDLRLNYEKYWYRADAVPKESEQDKFVCELMIKF